MSATNIKSRRKGPTLTYRERVVARQKAHTRRKAINTDVDTILEYIEREAIRLSIVHGRSVSWIRHQFYQGGRVVRQTRAVSVCNAARQIDSFLDGRKGGESSINVSVCDWMSNTNYRAD